MNHDRVQPEEVWSEIQSNSGTSLVFASSGTEQS
jgi:hypothetical protein